MQSPKTIGRISATRRINAVFSPWAKKALRQKGFAEGTIIRHWKEIVGESLANCAVPVRLAFGYKQKAKGATLHLLVDSGAALELQHRTAFLIEKLNLFYGYTVVSRIAIHQGVLPRKNEVIKKASKAPDEAVREQLDRLTRKIKNDDLKGTLTRLGEDVLQTQSKR